MGDEGVNKPHPTVRAGRRLDVDGQAQYLTVPRELHKEGIPPVGIPWQQVWRNPSSPMQGMTFG